MSDPRVYEWYIQFQQNRETTQENPRSGAPAAVVTEEDVEKARQIILENRRITKRELADELRISKGLDHVILPDCSGVI